jgi:FKBP-type peptidyl-prolyl cis-trans isomerase FklB
MSVTDKLAQMKAEKLAANLKSGQDFLANNKTQEGVVELPSGLQYKILKEGTGDKPTATDNVKCHYHGTLIDGTVFDSSVQRGTPAKFPLNMVIKGWTEGLQLMPVGSKWRFFIPPHLGYGERQVSAQIGPNSTLIFDVELLDIA